MRVYELIELLRLSRRKSSVVIHTPIGPISIEDVFFDEKNQHTVILSYKHRANKE